jgi:hypothetical protein
MNCENNTKKEGPMFKKSFCILALLLTAQAAFAKSFAGTYQVLQADCDNSGTLFVGDLATVVVNPNFIKIGELLYLGKPNGNPNNPVSFEVAFDLQIGTTQIPLGAGAYDIFEGNYSAGGSSFSEVRLYANSSQATPLVAGETEIILNGDLLEIDTTDNGQSTPAPMTECLLQMQN